MKKLFLTFSLVLYNLLALAGPRLDRSDYGHHGGDGGAGIFVILLVIVGLFFVLGGKSNEQH